MRLLLLHVQFHIQLHIRLSLKSIFFLSIRESPFSLPYNLFLFSHILTRSNLTKSTLSHNFREDLRSDFRMISPLVIRFAPHFLDMFVDIGFNCPCSCLKHRVAKRISRITRNREAFNFLFHNRCLGSRSVSSFRGSRINLSS